MQIREKKSVRVYFGTSLNAHAGEKSICATSSSRSHIAATLDRATENRALYPAGTTKITATEASMGTAFSIGITDAGTDFRAVSPANSFIIFRTNLKSSMKEVSAEPKTSKV